MKSDDKLAIALAQRHKIAEIAIDNYHPSLYDMTRYFRVSGLVGEEATALTATIGFLGAGMCVGFESASRGGKTEIMDRVISMPAVTTDYYKDIAQDRERLLNEAEIFLMDSGSDKSIAYLEESISRARAICYSEFNKVINGGTFQLEVAKSIGEGKSVTRDVVDAGKKQIRTQRIQFKNGNRGRLIYSLATENPTKLDVEMGNRIQHLFTDISATQTKNVMQSKAKRRFAKNKRIEKFEDDELLRFKKFVKNYFVHELTEFNIDNPFADLITDKYLPSKYLKSRAGVNFYFDFCDAISKWFIHQDKHKKYINDEKEEFYFTHLSDVWLTEAIYGKIHRLDMLHIPPQFASIDKVYEKYKEKISSKSRSLNEFSMNVDDRDDVKLSMGQIHEGLADLGINIDMRALEEILDELVRYHFINYDTVIKMPTSKYVLSGRKETIEDTLNYGELWDAGLKMMNEFYPAFVNDWIIEQTDAEGNINAIDPFTGENHLVYSTKNINKIIDVDIEKNITELISKVYNKPDARISYLRDMTVAYPSIDVKILETLWEKNKGTEVKFELI